MPSPMTASEDTSGDLVSVRSVVPRFFRALDNRDWDFVSRNLADDFLYETGESGRKIQCDEFISAQQKTATRLTVNRHFLTNDVIQMSSGAAQHMCYVMSHRFHGSADGGERYFAGGSLMCCLVLTPAGWLIRSLRYEQRFEHGCLDLTDAGSSGYPANSPAPEEKLSGPSGDSAQDPSDEVLVENLVAGFLRNADGGTRPPMEAALSASVTYRSAEEGETFKGVASVISALAANVGRLQRFLSNPVIMVEGDEASFGFYVYRVETGTETQPAEQQSGGVVLGKCSRAEGKWKISYLETASTWDAAVPLTPEVGERLLGAGHAVQVWSRDATRQQRSDEEELKLLMCKYTWYYDYADLRMSEVFAADVESSYSTDTNDVHKGREELLARLQRTRRTVHRFTQHYLGTIVVARHQDPDVAEVSGYVFTRRAPPGSLVTLSAAGRYDALARRVEGKWRFFAYHYVRAYPAWETLN